VAFRDPRARGHASSARARRLDRRRALSGLPAGLARVGEQPHLTIMAPDLTDEEIAALTRLLREKIDNDRYALETTEIEMSYLNMKAKPRPIDSQEKHLISVSWKDLFVLFIEEILTSREWRSQISLRLSYVVHDEIEKKYGDVSDYRVDELQSYVIDHIVLRFIGWGLLEGLTGNPRLTEYGQKQYGLLMP
jgi:hypothetical protein